MLWVWYLLLNNQEGSKDKSLRSLALRTASSQDGATYKYSLMTSFPKAMKSLASVSTVLYMMVLVLLITAQDTETWGGYLTCLRTDLAN